MKYLLMYNPTSGKAKFEKKLPFIIKYFEEKNLKLDIYRSNKPLDLETHASLVASKYDCIIISGGDGSINEVVNGIMKTKYRPNIGLIPSGTANDFASALGYKKNIKQNLKLITETKSIKMDVNLLNDRYFLYVIAAGILTRVSYDISRSKIKKYGYFAYISEGARDLFTRYKINAKITYDDGEIIGNYMLILGLSARRVGGMTMRNMKNTKLDNGKLEIRLVETVKRFRLSKLIMFFLTGGKNQTKNQINLLSSNYTIEACDTIAWNTDGEKATTGTINIKVLQQELSVYASEKTKKRLFSVK